MHWGDVSQHALGGGGIPACAGGGGVSPGGVCLGECLLVKMVATSKFLKILLVVVCGTRCNSHFNYLNFTVR